MKQKQKKSFKKIQKHKPQPPSRSQSRPSASRNRPSFPISSHRTDTTPSQQQQSSSAGPSLASGSKPTKLSELQQKFQKKLEGARFRTINERLYTCRGEEAFQEFQQNSNLFHLVSLSPLPPC